MKASDSFVKIYIEQSDGRAIICRADVIVDDTLEACVAWVFLKCSRQRSKAFFENDGGVRSEAVVNGHHYTTTETFTVFAGAGKRSATRRVCAAIWKKIGKSSFVSVVQEESNTTGMSPWCSETKFEAVRQESRNTKIQQTRVALSLKAESDRSPVIDYFDIIGLTRQISEMRSHFDKSNEVDKVERDEAVGIIRKNEEVYDDEENILVAAGMAILKTYHELANKKWVSVCCFCLYACE